MDNKNKPNQNNYQGVNPDVIELQLNSLINNHTEWINGVAFKDLTKEEFITAMNYKYAVLLKASERLFNKAINGELSTPQARANINQILEMLKQVASGKITQNDADIKYGKEQAAKYVDPLVEKLNKNSPNDK